MEELIANLRREAVHIWGGMSGPQQIIVCILSLLTMVSILFFANWASATSYRVAFSKLSDADSGAVINKLNDMKIPYQVSENGTAISVPANKVYDVRFQLASAGVLQNGGVGFELFDKTNFGATDFTERLNYRRALEGELSRTINSLAAVETSRVHIVIPQPELYSSKEKPGTASVLLKLRAGSRLDARQVRGIASLVSSSVEGLKPENVTIVDTNGNSLTQADDGLSQSLGASTTQLELQRSYEQETEQRVQTMLDTALGPNKAVVKVSALMDWDQVDTQSETYQQDPNGKTLVRSSHDVQENYAGTPSGVPATGSPGSDSNLKDKVTTSTDSSSNSKYDRKDITTNYELPKEVRHTVKAPGNLKRLSLAVIVDGSPDDANVNGLKQAISAAVGLDPQRGDTVEVMSMPFDRSFVQEGKEALQESEKWANYMEVGKVVAVVIPMVVFLLLLVLRTRRTRKKGSLSEAYEGMSLAEMEEEMVPEEVRKRKLVHEKVSELAKGRPEIVARLMRSWVEEG